MFGQSCIMRLGATFLISLTNYFLLIGDMHQNFVFLLYPFLSQQRHLILSWLLKRRKIVKQICFSIFLCDTTLSRNLALMQPYSGQELVIEELAQFNQKNFLVTRAFIQLPRDLYPRRHNMYNTSKNKYTKCHFKASISKFTICYYNPTIHKTYNNLFNIMKIVYNSLIHEKILGQCYNNIKKMPQQPLLSSFLFKRILEIYPHHNTKPIQHTSATSSFIFLPNSHQPMFTRLTSEKKTKILEISGNLTILTIVRLKYTILKSTPTRYLQNLLVWSQLVSTVIKRFLLKQPCINI